MKKDTSPTLLLLAACCFSAVTAADDAYTTKYDNVNIDEVLTNSRLYKSYFDCLIGEGKCTTEGKTLKEILPDALATKCGKCNEKQKAGAQKVLKFIINQRPDDWAQLEKIYDPDGTYKAKYKEGAKEQYGLDLS